MTRRLRETYPGKRSRRQIGKTLTKFFAIARTNSHRVDEWPTHEASCTWWSSPMPLKAYPLKPRDITDHMRQRVFADCALPELCSQTEKQAFLQGARDHVRSRRTDVLWRVPQDVIAVLRNLKDGALMTPLSALRSRL